MATGQRAAAEQAIGDYYRRHQQQGRTHTTRIKTAPILLRTEGYFVHGIDEDEWQRVANAYDDLFIWELSRQKGMVISPVLLMRPLEFLRGHIDNTIMAGTTPMFPRGMVFWKRADLLQVYPAPKEKTLSAHYCEHPGCDEIAAYGYGPRGIEGLFAPTRWYCGEHRPENFPVAQPELPL